MPRTGIEDRLEVLFGRAIREVRQRGLRVQEIQFAEMADGSHRYAAFVNHTNDAGNELLLRVTEPASPDAPQWAREKFPDWNTDDLEGWA